MRSRHIAYGCLLAIAVVASSPAKDVELKPGDVAPAHLGTTLEGKPVLVSDFPGKAVVVSYWASWCTFCVHELALLSAIQSSASDRVQVVAVNVEPMYIFKKNLKGLSRFQMLVIHDADRKAQKAYGVSGIPHMVIVGKDGRIDTVNIGYTEKELDGIVQSINHAIGAVPPTQSGST